MNLSVLTLNLRFNNPDDGENAWPHRVDRVVQFLRERKPCIAGTEEGLYSMLVELQEALPGYEWIGSSRGAETEDEHCAVFYDSNQVELTDHGQFWLSETPEEVNSVSWESACPRICTWGVFRLLKEPSRSFAVFNTHLDHVSQEAREKGMALILETIKPYSNRGLPIVLMGDLNAEPENAAVGSVETAGLVNAYSTMSSSPGATFHNFQGWQTGQPIDYIFTSPEVRILDVNIFRKALNGGYLSDHYPVTAELEI